MIFFIRIVSVLLLLIYSLDSVAANNPKVIVQTNLGDITIELYPHEAPATVRNFLEYVDSNFYQGTIFHRVIPGFIIQGGGLNPDFAPKKTRDPVKNESNNGLKNDYLTVAMANTITAVNGNETANSQFFINLQKNSALDANGKTTGYAVFGKVIEGIEVAEKISTEPRGMYESFPESPNTPVKILAIQRLDNHRTTADLKSEFGSKTTLPSEIQQASKIPASNLQ